MINYHVGDATDPVGEGNKLIIHVCNDVGGWGAGFVLALSKRWQEPEYEYRRWAKGKAKIPFKLGRVQLVKIESSGDPLEGKGLWVINMVAQEGYGEPGKPPIRYDALRECLESVNRLATLGLLPDASIHMPRIGCGLAGGKWEEVEKIISETIADEVSVNVYDLPQ